MLDDWILFHGSLLCVCVCVCVCVRVRLYEQESNFFSDECERQIAEIVNKYWFRGINHISLLN